MGAEQPPQFGFKYDTSDTPEGWKRVYPIGKDGTERVWRMSYNTGKINYKWDNLELVNSLLWCSPDSFTLYQIVSDKKSQLIVIGLIKGIMQVRMEQRCLEICLGRILHSTIRNPSTQ